MKCQVTCLQQKFTEKGKCLLLPFSCLYNLLGKQGKKESQKLLRSPWLDTGRAQGYLITSHPAGVPSVSIGVCAHEIYGI